MLTRSVEAERHTALLSWRTDAQQHRHWRGRRPTAEDVRVAFADIWGDMGPAWNVTPSVARVHGYLLAQAAP